MLAVMANVSRPRMGAIGITDRETAPGLLLAGGFSISAIRHLIFNTIENVVHIHPHVSKLSGFHIHIKIKRSPAKT